MKVIVMPSWSIHCAIAKKVMKDLDIDANTFLFGNIIADVDDEINYYGSYATHYYGIVNSASCPSEELPDIEGFYQKYKFKINDPLILGYYCHLLTDYYFNEYTYANHWLMDEAGHVIGAKLKDGNELATKSLYKLLSIKRKDFAKFGRQLYDLGLTSFPVYDKEIIKHCQLLEPNFISDRDIKVMISKIYPYLEDASNSHHEYTILSEEELYKMMEDTYQNIINRFKELKITKGNVMNYGKGKDL